jgi:hypothetical protein
MIKGPIFYLLLVGCLCDELYYVDYDTGFEYSWDALQSPTDYKIETSTDIIWFNLAANVEVTCQGHSAAVIKVSKAGDSCEILGRHEVVYYTPFKTIQNSGIIVFYEGGAICKNKLWNAFKRRVEFKFTCSTTEREFTLANSLNDCTVILEKFTQYGCPREYEYTAALKIIFISYELYRLYAFFAILLIWLCYEAVEADNLSEDSWAGRIFYSKTKVNCI